jgi:hypothetical protein
MSKILLSVQLSWNGPYAILSASKLIDPPFVDPDVLNLQCISREAGVVHLPRIR